MAVRLYLILRSARSARLEGPPAYAGAVRGARRERKSLIFVAPRICVRALPPRKRGIGIGAGVDTFGNTAVAGDRYLIASGLTGEPTAPVMGSAGATNMKS